MRKVIGMTLMVLMLFSFLTITTLAADDDLSFSFNLTVDGKEQKEVKTGDIITVTLKLHRTDVTEPYTMYAMQDEIRYDSTFFELVENSEVLNMGIVTTDISMVDRYREFYMNYLSMSGGIQWDADMLIGSIQLRVIGKTGVTKITNQDYLVSLKDGSNSFTCDAEDVTIILSTECVVRFMSNGANEIPDQIVQYGEKIICPETPIREGYTFGGWYKDINLTDEWDFENETVQENMFLYAKWISGSTSENKMNSNIWWLLILLILFLCWMIKKKINRTKQ